MRVVRIEPVVAVEQRCWLRVFSPILPALPAKQTVGAASEREKGHLRIARACSPILAALPAKQLAELLIELTIELASESLIGLRADSATGFAADFAHV